MKHRFIPINRPRVYRSEHNRQFNIVIVPASRLGEMAGLKQKALQLPAHTALIGIPEGNETLVGVAHRIEWKSRHGRDPLAVLISPIH